MVDAELSPRSRETQAFRRWANKRGFAKAKVKDTWASLLGKCRMASPDWRKVVLRHLRAVKNPSKVMIVVLPLMRAVKTVVGGGLGVGWGGVGGSLGLHAQLVQTGYPPIGRNLYCTYFTCALWKSLERSTAVLCVGNVKGRWSSGYGTGAGELRGRKEWVLWLRDRGGGCRKSVQALHRMSILPVGELGRIACRQAVLAAKHRTGKSFHQLFFTSHLARRSIDNLMRNSPRLVSRVLCVVFCSSRLDSYAFGPSRLISRNRSSSLILFSCCLTGR